jgi:hypothetical protein
LIEAVMPLRALPSNSCHQRTRQGGS